MHLLYRVEKRGLRGIPSLGASGWGWLGAIALCSSGFGAATEEQID
ncbi:MAG: hypothetical protein U7126_11735 [Microcoleus sp.]